MNIHRETRAAQPDQQKHLKLSRLNQRSAQAKGGVPRRGEGVCEPTSKSNSGAAHSSVACGATSPNLGEELSYSATTSRGIQTPPPERGGAQRAGGSHVQQGAHAQQADARSMGNTRAVGNPLPPAGYSPFQAGELRYSDNSQLRNSPAQPIGHQPSAHPDPSGALQSLQISAAEAPVRYKGFNFRRRPQPPVTKPPIFAVGADCTLQSPRFPAADVTARYKGANPPRRRFCNPLRPLKRNSIHF